MHPATTQYVAQVAGDAGLLGRGAAPTLTAPPVAERTVE